MAKVPSVRLVAHRACPLNNSNAQGWRADHSEAPLEGVAPVNLCARNALLARQGYEQTATRGAKGRHENELRPAVGLGTIYGAQDAAFVYCNGSQACAEQVPGRGLGPGDLRPIKVLDLVLAQRWGRPPGPGAKP